jgi:hypothetical protein
MADNLVIDESLDLLEVQQIYDAIAAWLRDCVWKSTVLSMKHAEAKLKMLDVLLAEKFGEA